MKKIIIPKRTTADSINYTVALTGDAVEALQKVMKKTRLPAKRVVSVILVQAVENDLIVVEGEEEETI